MVFVHARNATVKTAMGLIEMAKNRGETCFFQPDQGPDYGQCEKQVNKEAISHLYSNQKNCMLYCVSFVKVYPSFVLYVSVLHYFLH